MRARPSEAILDESPAVAAGTAAAPLVVHVVRRLAVGGLENGLVNLINRMPVHRYRHAIVCLSDATDFRHRLARKDVSIITLHKREGQDLAVHGRFWRLLRRLRPAIVHTRNLAGLEYLITAAAAGVPARIHGEHGRDVYDLDGTSWKYNLIRKAVRPFAHRFVAVSAELADWLVDTVGARRDRVVRICNGVDLDRFQPATLPRPRIGPEGFAPRDALVVGTVGRMEAVKDQLTLVRAFLHLRRNNPAAAQRLRLVLIGDGALLNEARTLLREAGAEGSAWLPGEQGGIPEILRGLDLFVLPSIREGISNTILEAMASGLPVIATRVGGNPELIEEGETGVLVPPSDPVAMANAIRAYLLDPVQLERHGQAGRKRVETQFSLEAMVNGYLAVYDSISNPRHGHGQE